MCEPMTDLLVESLKEYFRAEQMSDKVLYITEIDESKLKPSSNLLKREHGDESPSKRFKLNDHPLTSEEVNFNDQPSFDGESQQTNNNSDGEPHVSYNAGGESLQNVIRDAYSFFPVHTLILSINSSYFKTVNSITGMRESSQNYIEVKVNKGEGKFVELLINAFYDQDILKTLGVLELLKVLELGNRFLCNTLIGCGLKLLESLDIKTIEECDQVIEQIKVFQCSTLLKDCYTFTRKLCGKYLAKYFKFVDCYIAKHDTFNALSFDSVLLLITQDDQKFVWHENNIIYFITNWLAVDEVRQTVDNIQKLLHQVRYEYMTVEYFKDVLLINHPILSKWSGYNQWYVDAILFHSLSAEEKTSREITSGRKNRTFRLLRRHVQICSLHIAQSTTTPVFMSLTDHKYILHEGYKLTPTIDIIRVTNANSYELVLRLYFGSNKETLKFYRRFVIAFGVFYNLKGGIPQALFHAADTSFICNNYQHIDVEFKNNNMFKTSIGTIDGELFQKFKDHGINVSILFKRSGLFEWPLLFHSLNVLSVTRRDIHRTVQSQKILDE